MAVGDNTIDSVLWFPGEATGHKPGGQSASPPAAHSNGVGALSLLGPYTVAFDHPNITTLEYIVFDDVPSGSVVIRAFATSSDWVTTSSSTYVDIHIGPNADGADSIILVTYPTAPDVVQDRPTELQGSSAIKVVPTQPNDKLLGYVTINDLGTASAGELQFYALIGSITV